MSVGGGPLYERLEQLLLGEEGERIRSLDHYMQREEPANTITVLTTNTSNLRRIGSILTDTDREFRRAAVIIGSGPDGRPSYYFGDTALPPRPVHPVDGGFLVRDASPGSLHLLVDAYGAVLTLLLSQPMSALVTIAALGQTAASVRVWLNRRKHADLDKQPLEALTEARRGVGRVLEATPDQRIDIRPPEEDERYSVVRDDAEALPEPPVMPLQEQAEVPGSELYAGEFYVRGHQITYIRTYPDGTQDTIYVQS
jgi:hypothetical protein